MLPSLLTKFQLGAACCVAWTKGERASFYGNANHVAQLSHAQCRKSYQQYPNSNWDKWKNSFLCRCVLDSLFGSIEALGVQLSICRRSLESGSSGAFWRFSKLEDLRQMILISEPRKHLNICDLHHIDFSGSLVLCKKCPEHPNKNSIRTAIPKCGSGLVPH